LIDESSDENDSMDLKVFKLELLLNGCPQDEWLLFVLQPISSEVSTESVNNRITTESVIKQVKNRGIY
jgi:hypothetical protein